MKVVTKKMEQIDALEAKVSGHLPSARKDSGRELVLLELTHTERNLIADALMVLYGTESAVANP